MTTEILTESFCERCGTRYEFDAPEPLSATQKTRGLVSGLRAFIMSTDSLSDSISDAMRAEEETLAAAQIEAFQQAFNFCLDCRRYTCVNCWNDDSGRCRSCVPLMGVDDIAGFEQRLAHPTFTAGPADATVQLTTAEALTWPAEDSVVPATGLTDGELVEVEPEAAAAEEVVPEPVAAAAEEVVPEPVAAVAAEPEAAEPEAAEPEAAEPEAAEPEPPIAPPPLVTRPRRDLRDTFVRGPIRPPLAASKPAGPESLAARRSQLDSLGIDDPGEGTVSVGQRTELPYRSSGAAVGGSTLAKVWDASTRTLEAGAQRASLRPCGSCGLTVSSTARFCRRCGAPQTLSA